jgi:hypothetical protein
MAGHRTSKHDTIYRAVNEILKNDDWSYYTVEKFMFDDKFELRNREQFFIDNNECVNKRRAYTSHEHAKTNRALHAKEWREKNRDKIYEYSQKYKDENKDAKLAYAKKYREDNGLNEKCHCDCGGSYNKNNKKRHEQTKKHLNYISTK